MSFVIYDSASAMLEKAEGFLLKREARHNLPLGLLKQFAKEESQKDGYSRDLFMAAGKSKDGEINVVLLRTPPENLIICGKKDAVRQAADWLHKQHAVLPGVTGCAETSRIFAEEWGRLTGAEAEKMSGHKIYQLNELKDIPKKPGKLTYATEDDIALAMAWTEEYEDMIGSCKHPDLEKTVRQEIKNNQVYFWRDDHCTPVSMAKKGRELKNGAVLNFVYTPEDYQRQGYATTCVAALSERLFKEGYKFCSLNTNAENPASNTISVKIGFEPVGEAAEYRFYNNGLSL